MLCGVCKTNKARKDILLGYLPCISCQKRQNFLKKPGRIPEFTTDDIKESRKAYFDDIHPAHRKGVPSREFRDRWGKEAMRRQGYSEKEINEAKYVWLGDDSYYKDGN